MSLSIAVWERLAGDPTFAAMNAAYLGGRAVLVADDNTFPAEVPTPFTVVAGPEQDEPFDTKDFDGREQLVIVRFYTDRTGSTAAVDAMAERGRWLLHRKPQGLAPGAFIAACSGPVVTPTDPSMYGRELAVRVTSLTTTQDQESS